MSLTIDTVVYTQGLQLASNLGFNFIGANHTGSLPEYMQLIATPAKPTATSEGKNKSNLRVVSGATNGTDALMDAIANIQVSIPVGMVSSEEDAFIARVQAFAASAAFVSLVKNRTVVG